MIRAPDTTFLKPLNFHLTKKGVAVDGWGPPASGRVFWLYPAKNAGEGWSPSPQASAATPPPLVGVDKSHGPSFEFDQIPRNKGQAENQPHRPNQLIETQHEDLRFQTVIEGSQRGLRSLRHP